MDIPWGEADHTRCTEESKPNTNLFKQSHYTGEDRLYLVSENDWCISCYSLYIDVCKSIAQSFPPELRLSLNKKQEFSVDAFRQTVGALLEYDGLCLAIIEPVLKSILDCIIARSYHHKSCYMRTRNFFVNRGVQNSDSAHTSFLMVLCEAIADLLVPYRVLVETKNKVKRKKGEPLHIPLYEQETYVRVTNVCSSLLTRDEDVIAHATNDSGIQTNKDLKSVKHFLGQKYDRSRTKASRRRRKNKALSRPKKAYTLPHPRR